MKQEVVQGIASFIMKTSIGGAAISSFVAWLDFVNSYAAGLGVIVSFIGIVIATLFQYFANKKKNENAEKIKELQRIVNDNNLTIRAISDRKSRTIK